MGNRFKQNLCKVNLAEHQIVTPVCTLSYNDLFEAKAGLDGGEPKYRATLMFDSKEELAQPVKLPGRPDSLSLRDAIMNVKRAQWGDDKTKWPTEKHPVVVDGNTKKQQDGTQNPYTANKWIITAKTGAGYPPIILNQQNQPATRDQIFMGDLVQAQILLRPYIMGGNAGVTLRLVAIKKVADGEGSGSRRAQTWFGDAEPSATEPVSDLAW